MKKITVIGGSGFIGTELIRLIKGESEVINIDKRPSANFSEITKIADVRDVKALRSSMVPSDAVVLLAAEHSDNVSPISLYYDVNVEGAKKVAAVCSDLGISKIIFTSTVAVYGLNKADSLENGDTEPFNDYGKSKLQAEKVLEQWYNEKPNERNLIIIRPTVVFGPGNRGNVYNLLRQIISGKFVMIGRGKNVKSMCYINNIAEFIRFCLNRNEGFEIFNFADKPDLTTRELVAMVSEYAHKRSTSLKIPYSIGIILGHAIDIISKITGKKFSISAIRIKKFCSDTVISSAKVAGTGFKSPYTLEEGLKTTIESIQKEFR